MSIGIETLRDELVSGRTGSGVAADGARDGLTYYYDVNATSNFVADAPRVLGFDPYPAFVDFITARAQRRSV